MASDNELLRRYTVSRSEEAFAELVQRHLNLVYFTALRRTNGQAQLAEEVAQLVFITLARQAALLERHAVLAGWLYVSTRHAAAKVMRAEQRRKMREQEAHALQEISSPLASEADWSRLRPELDAVLDDLNARDRDAVLLRFFENRPFVEIGAALRISEDAARMRVDRTLDKLRALLARRGIVSTTAALALALEQPVGAAAPAALAASISGAVLANATISGTAATAGLGFLTFMSSTKIITGVATAIALIAMGSALYEAREARASMASAISLNEQVRMAEARSADLQRQLEQNQKDRLTAQQAQLTVAAAQKDSPPAPASPPRADDPLTNPEARRLRHQKLEVQLTLNIRPFFSKLGFTDEQWERYRALIVGEQEVEMDAHAVARAQGLSAREEEMLIVQAANEARSNLLALLGDEANKQLIQWNQVLAVRNFAGELAGKLMYTDEPLTSEQADQYLKVLTSNQRSLRRSSDGIFFLPEPVMTQLQSLLSPGQFAILQQQQLAHRTDQQMAALSKK